MTAFDRAWSVAKEDPPRWVDDFTANTNMNPHYDPDYLGQDEECETEGCPNPARTGMMTYSGGYIGKVTVCNDCWQNILEDLERHDRTGVGGWNDGV